MPISVNKLRRLKQSSKIFGITSQNKEKTYCNSKKITLAEDFLKVKEFFFQNPIKNRGIFDTYFEEML